MVIFATIFGVGFVVLLFSLIFGGDAEVEADVGVDADTGSGGPNIFSVRMVAMLMVGFGAVGFGTRASTDATMFISSMAGVGGAIVVGVIGYVIIRAFYASQESSTITENDIMGRTANLIDAITEGGTGQVACIVRGREITYLARSKDGNAINRGVPVRIVSKAGNTVTVEPAE